MKLSTRNQLKGTVASITKGVVNSEVVIQLPGKSQIVSIITNGAVKNLELEEGSKVIALIKASNVMLGIEVGKISARNVLCGKVTSVNEGAVNTEVLVDLGDGCSITSVITKMSAQNLGLTKDVKVCAIVKASSVIVAVE